jgi:hypothetical protein
MYSAKTHRKVTMHAAKAVRLKKRIRYLLVILAVSALAGLLIYYTLGPKNSGITDTTPKIAIIDHLSVQWPDQDFNQTTQTILNQTGLKVDYYPTEEVTVDFYRNLPKHNYKLIIFRVHSTATSSVNDTPPFVVFFTSELYSNAAHTSEQTDMRVVWVKFPNNQTIYFGITPKFVKESMEGRFNDTVIIAMGCEGLKQTTMAQAFIEKGAKAYISWNGTVTADHTDEATISLLRHLITEKKTVDEAIRETMEEVAPDPTDNSILTFYPTSTGTTIFPVNIIAIPPTIKTESTKEIRKY